MERKYIIYSHTTPSGKVYIGQTCRKDPNERWKSGKGYKACKLFYNSIKKYGWDNIEHKILHTGLTKEKADILEKMYIRFFKRKNISLNLTDGGEGSTGRIISAETRKKLSEAKKGKVLTAEHRRKIGEAHKGKHYCTSEHRRKLSESNKRRVWTSESRRKLSEVNKGKVLTEEQRRKISDSNKGKHRSLETRKKMSESQKGKIVSVETRRKMSEVHKGRPIKRSIWLNEFQQEVEMANASVAHHHPNWIKVRSL